MKNSEIYRAKGHFAVVQVFNSEYSYEKIVIKMHDELFELNEAGRECLGKPSFLRIFDLHKKEFVPGLAYRDQKQAIKKAKFLARIAHKEAEKALLGSVSS